MNKPINKILNILQLSRVGTSQLSIRASSNTSSYLIQPTLTIADTLLKTGQKHYLETLKNKTFRVSSPSFFQVNTQQTEKIIDMIAHNLEFKKSDFLLDAYSGVGTFPAMYAHLVKEVFTLEESKSSASDSSINNTNIPNITIMAGKVEDLIDSLTTKITKVILDPPRAGCDPIMLKAISRLENIRLVYVSCNAKTLSRDLSILVNRGLKLKLVEPIDMFPHTRHIECIATLDKNI